VRCQPPRPDPIVQSGRPTISRPISRSITACRVGALSCAERAPSPCANSTCHATGATFEAAIHNAGEPCVAAAPPRTGGQRCSYRRRRIGYRIGRIAPRLRALLAGAKRRPQEPRSSSRFPSPRTHRKRTSSRIRRAIRAPELLPPDRTRGPAPSRHRGRGRRANRRLYAAVCRVDHADRHRRVCSGDGGARHDGDAGGEKADKGEGRAAKCH